MTRSPPALKAGIAFGVRALGLLTALAAAAACLIAPTPAAATPITYTLSGVTATFVPFGTDTLTGSFSFDPSTITLDSEDITVTGPFQPGNYNITQSASPSSISAYNNGLTVLMEIGFASNLGTTSDSITSVIFFGSIIGTSGSSSVTGSAVPASNAVPEPASLALLGGALGLFLLTRRLNRSGCRA